MEFGIFFILFQSYDFIYDSMFWNFSIS